MPLSLGQLLAATWSTFRKLFVPILVGVLVLLAVYALGGFFLGPRLQNVFQELTGVNSQEMQQLQVLGMRAQQGDTSAATELKKMQQGIAQRLTDKGSPEYVKTLFLSAAPLILLTILAFFIIQVFITTYLIVVAAMQQTDIGKLLCKTCQAALPMVGIYLWSLLRSFLWLPLAGVILGLLFPPLWLLFLISIPIGAVLQVVLVPRFLLAPIIFIREGTGVLKSVQLSYERSRGYWGKIVGNLFVLGVLSWVIGFALVFLFGIIGGMIGQVIFSSLFFVFGFKMAINYFLYAVMAIFLMHLTLTITEHPRRA